MAFWNVFGGDLVKSVGEVAKEWIDTDIEKAEANAIMVKTLDPNGQMRRQISTSVARLYVLYILLVMVLVLAQSFNLGDATGTKLAIESLKELFLPVTAMFTAIVGASFGTNVSNNMKESRR